MNAANVANENTELVDDLAAQWTDSTLEILRALGIKGSSVPMELETWHTLREVLQSLVRRQPRFRFPPASVDELMEPIFLRATMKVARKFEPGADAFELENRIRPLIQRRKLKTSESRPYVRRSSRANRVTFHGLSAVGGYSGRVS